MWCVAKYVWPGICALHFTHPSEHEQQRVANTHTAASSEHTRGAVGSHFCCAAQGALGGLVPCSRVSHQMWYWGWKKVLVILSAHPQFWDSSQKLQMCLEVPGFAVIYCQAITLMCISCFRTDRYQYSCFEVLKFTHNWKLAEIVI